jgi:hypothetical protein
MPGKSERRWAVTLGFAVMLLMTLPYLVGYASQGKNWHYTGLLIAAEDGQSYFAKMLLGANGDWLFKTPYTLTPQNGFLAFLPYLILGKLTSPPGQSEQMAGLFHILRFSGGILAALATYDGPPFSLWWEVGSVGWRCLGCLCGAVQCHWSFIHLSHSAFWRCYRCRT